MATDITPSDFDYTDLADDDARALESHAEVIGQVSEQVRRVGAEGVIAIGKELAAAQKRLAGKGRDGVFRRWVEMRCGFTSRTAYNAIAACNTFGGKKCENVSHFDTSALYLLSADSCPESATKEAIRLAKKGEKITHKRAKELKVKHSPQEEIDDVFEFAEEADWVFKTIRNRTERWPEDHRPALSQILKQLSEEALL